MLPGQARKQGAAGAGLERPKTPQKNTSERKLQEHLLNKGKNKTRSSKEHKNDKLKN